jgi:hypothetical protein
MTGAILTKLGRAPTAKTTVVIEEIRATCAARFGELADH